MSAEIPVAARGAERLLDYWTRMSVEMEGCPIPTEACQIIGCNDGEGCWVDDAIRAVTAALDVAARAIEGMRRLKQWRSCCQLCFDCQHDLAEVELALLPPATPERGEGPGA